MDREKAGFISSSPDSAHGEENYSSVGVSHAHYRLEKDVFGDETGNGIHYRTLSWPFVAFLMITEIVTYGTLSLPYSLATVGIIPGVILIVFLGAFALYTALVLIKFKINHPEGTNIIFASIMV